MTAPSALRIGLLGCGWIARNRLRQIAALRTVDVTAIADTDAAALEVIAAAAPIARVVADANEFDPRQVDGVVVSTPSALHARQALALLERGLPVFVQKPIALSAREAQEVLDTAALADVPLGTDLCYRDLESARAVRTALQDGSIGEPFLVDAWFHNAYRPGSGWAYDPALSGGGSLIDLGIHLLDLVTWLSGRTLLLRRARLYCRGQPWREGAVEDFACLDLELDGGAAVRLTACWDAATGHDAEIGLRIYGDRGTLLLGNRAGSFYDFEALRCHGTRSEVLASDDGDLWQAGPLCRWLDRLAAGAGYEPPGAVDETMTIIDSAYRMARSRRMEPAAPGPTVHACVSKGVVP